MIPKHFGAFEGFRGTFHYYQQIEDDIHALLDIGCYRGRINLKSYSCAARLCDSC